MLKEVLWAEGKYCTPDIWIYMKKKSIREEINEDKVNFFIFPILN